MDPSKLIEAYLAEKFSLRSHPIFSTFPSVLFGGAVRDILLQDPTIRPKDLDIVVDSSEEALSHALSLQGTEWTHTKFGGFRFQDALQMIDVWTLDSTWAIANGYVIGSGFDKLINSTFFNADAAFYHLTEARTTMKYNYLNDLQSRFLDINLEANVSPKKMCVRALRMSRERGFTLSPRLHQYVLEHGNETLK